MKRKLISILFTLVLLLSFGIVATTPVMAVDREVGPGKTYATIQDAVDAAVIGDTIKVYPDTYDEQVTITKDELTLVSVNAQEAVIAPTTLCGDKAIVKIDGAAGVTIDGLKITGPVNGINYGVMVVGSGSAKIENNLIADIRDEPFSGRHSGVAILVGRGSIGTTGTATILSNVITGFQKCGIVVDNEGSNATITGNTIEGAGKTSVTAQNAIQISRLATAEVRGNNISDVWYDTGIPGQGQEPWWSAGLLLYDIYPNSVKYSKNRFENCHVNLLLIPHK